VGAARAALVAGRGPRAEVELSTEDATGFRRLCRPGSPVFLVDHPRYWARFAEALFWGRVGAPADRVGG